MEENLPHFLRVQDLSLATATGTGRERMARNIQEKYRNGWSVVVTEW
jgi:hypothetical protein